MSDTVAVVERRIRIRIKDLDFSAYEVDKQELRMALDDSMHRVAARTRPGQVLVTSLVTLIANQSDYTLTANQYKQIVYFRLASLGWDLLKRTTEEMEALRRSPAGSIAKGPPDSYTLWEDTTQTVTLRVFPTPTQADTLDALVSYIPGLISADADTVPFDRELTKCVELWTAQLAVAGMTDEAKARRRLTKDIVEGWGAQAEDFLTAGAARVNRLQRTGQVGRRTK